MDETKIVNRMPNRPALRWHVQSLNDPSIKDGLTQIYLVCGKRYFISTHIGKCFGPEVSWLDKVKGLIEVTYWKIIQSPYELGKEIETKLTCQVSIEDFKPLRSTKRRAK